MSSAIMSSDIAAVVSVISSSAMASSGVVVSVIASVVSVIWSSDIASVVAGLDAESFDELPSLPHAARASAATMARAAGVRVRIRDPPCDVAPGVGSVAQYGTVPDR